MKKLVTIKVTSPNLPSGKNPQYLCHGGGLRSHTIYSSDLDKIDFSKLNMSDFELSCEFERLKGIVPLGTIEVVRVAVDENMKYISEEKNQLKKCRVCGCTDGRSCPGGCYWVEDDLCSTCHQKLNEEKTNEVYLLGYCTNKDCSEFDGGWKYPHDFSEVDQQECECINCGEPLTFIEQCDES